MKKKKTWECGSINASVYYIAKGIMGPKEVANNLQYI